MGRAIVEGKLFGPKAGLEVASSVARAYTRNVFTPEAILKAIDTKCQGALNDGGVWDYAQIEKLMGPVKAKRGHALLQDHNRIGACRKILNKVAEPIFGVAHNSNPTKSQHGDHVQVNYEKMVRYLLDGFGLRNKAVELGGVELVFTCDGATIAGAKSASQTAAGIKIMDIDAIDPDNGDKMEKMFIDAVDDGNNVVLLKNYQTFKNHAMTEIILHSETKQIINDVFAEFFKFGMQLDRGLPAS